MPVFKKIIPPLLVTVLTLALLIILKTFLIPLAYGLLMALIIYPVFRSLKKRKVPSGWAIFLSMLLVTAVFAAIISLFILQFWVLDEMVPDLLLELDRLVGGLRNYVQKSFGLSLSGQDQLILNLKQSLSSNIGPVISGSLSLAGSALFNIIIIPIYAVLFLHYRKALVALAGTLAGPVYNEHLAKLFSEAVRIYFNYIKGMFWVYLSVGTLNSIGLLILGVDYAILWGMVSAFMTIIPYVGIVISSILPISLAWMETNNILYPLGVVAVYSVVQYLEANLIFPYIVGRQLGVNTLVSIIAILLGGVVWGVSGMILFLPFVALLKIVSGHVNRLKPLHDFLNQS